MEEFSHGKTTFKKNKHEKVWIENRISKGFEWEHMGFVFFLMKHIGNVMILIGTSLEKYGEHM